ncbi:hypothetical protein [Paludisphaera mucosa]|uniref:Uncharacterized protein n=1 Tax=Paludisphaera mucosa TaxID=3030827 RepID=A0ABT6F5W3_9BACT|nr:hypothetical protein [Paludisphaera mucosa]MDG3002986.1 hypothetical protein [Paludisphaera mucosa]
MTQPTEFNLESDWIDPPPSEPSSTTEPAAPAEPRPAEPVVVIQYRSRGLSPFLLFPLTLITALALFAGYHHFFVEPIFSRGGFAPPRNEPGAGIEKPSGAAASPNLDETLAQVSAAIAVQPQVLPMPLTLESQPLPLGLPPSAQAFPQPAAAGPAASTDALIWPGSEPAPPTSVASRPVETPKPADEIPVAANPTTPGETPTVERDRSRISIASTSPDTAKPAPTPDSAAPDARPLAEPPPPTREEMMERIRQEAELKQAQQEELERRKQEAVARFDAEAVERVDNERVTFRKALQDIVSAGGRDAGQAIDDLCDQFGRGYSQELKDRAYAGLAHYKGKLTRDGEIRMLRTLGVPEAGILDYLANRAHRTINSRNGPRDSGEVRLIAARQLLRIPPAPATPGAPGATSPAAVPARPSAIRRTTSPNANRQ